MILRILLLASAVLIAPSIAKMDLSTFLGKFEAKCFQDEETDPFLVYGQETPLSSTMDNFIAMAEKFEVANPSANLKEELNYFISEYLFENIKITGRRISEIPIERVKFEKIDALWDHDPATYTPEYQDPFSDDEKCSLYFMISHSILAKDTSLMRSYGNDSNIYRTDLKPEDYYPQELGVVAVNGADGPVSLSKILLGLYVGLQQNRKTELRTHTLNFRDVIHQEKLDIMVDPLYLVTMAEVLMLSSWEGFERKGMAKYGRWVSIPLGEERIDGFCPMVYKHDIQEGTTKLLPAYSIASVRGAADGLILGLAVNKIDSSEAKLSRILRMYYSPRGIVAQENIEDINLPQVSFCTRDKVIQKLELNLQEQMIAYGYLVAISESDIDKSYQASKTKYEENKYAIYQIKVDQGFCTPPTTLDKPEDLPVETFLDVIVVMDTSKTPKNFLDQQLITGYLAKQLDLRYSGSQLTILLDQKINSVSTPGSPSTIQLKPVVNGTYSSSCAACTVGQLPFEQSTVPREDVVIAVDQLLQAMKDNETALNGVNGKIVIYFNYENGDGRTTNNRVQEKVDKALRDLNIRHPDVLLYAVGLDSEILMKYARDDPSLIFLVDDKIEEVADKIFKKISFAPAILQYTDCKDARNEKAATYESFVSPNKIQHYFMPAEYFYKSFNAKVVFESQDGLIKVCYNRATMKPENEAKHCKETTPNTFVEFKINNPCKSFTKERCAPLYFAVMGKDPAAENGNQVQRQRSNCKANDRLCSTLDQIKFKVSHDGIRCSGCLGLGAPPAVILFTVLLTYFLYKRI